MWITNNSTLYLPNCTISKASGLLTDFKALLLSSFLWTAMSCLCLWTPMVMPSTATMRMQTMLAITTSQDWPTTEMASRTGWSCLVVGVAVAVPSGLGVAISVLGGNSGSMVGE